MSTPPPPPPGFNPPPPAYGGPQYGTPQPAPPGQQGYGAPPPGYQPYQGYPQQQQRTFAGFGARLGAVIIDWLISLIFSIPGLIAFFVVPKHYEDCTVNGEEGICKVPTGAGVAMIGVISAVFGIAYLVIYCRKVGRGQSWGQKACSIRVVDKTSGAQIGTGRSVGRYFAKIISALPCFLGFLWALWDQDKQTWHDKIVGSVVVKD